jgi:hypothetical protein
MLSLIIFLINDRDNDEAGPSNDHTQKLDQMCDILMGMGLTRDDLKRKGEELNWDQDSITFFIATQLQNE